MTGLPRADRWVEVRSGVVEHLLEVAREHGQVVVDTGFSLEQDAAPEFGSRPGRNQMTQGALDVADEIVVVGSADPVGLSRLARGLVELRDLDRRRAGAGRGEPDAAHPRLVREGHRGHGRGVHPAHRRCTSCPRTGPAVDKALVAGRTVVEVGDSALGSAVAEIVDALAPGTAASPTGRRPRRVRPAG